MLEIFKSRKLLENQHAIERQVEILKKVGNKSESLTPEELDELSNKHDSYPVTLAIGCYLRRRDFRGGFEAVVRFGYSASVTSFWSLLVDLQTFYEMLVDRSFLCIENIQAEFGRL